MRVTLKFLPRSAHVPMSRRRNNLNHWLLSFHFLLQFEAFEDTISLSRSGECARALFVGCRIANAAPLHLLSFVILDVVFIRASHLAIFCTVWVAATLPHSSRNVFYDSIIERLFLALLFFTKATKTEVGFSSANAFVIEWVSHYLPPSFWSLFQTATSTKNDVIYIQCLFSTSAWARSL